MTHAAAGKASPSCRSALAPTYQRRKKSDSTATTPTDQHWTGPPRTDDTQSSWPARIASAWTRYCEPVRASVNTFGLSMPSNTSSHAASVVGAGVAAPSFNALMRHSRALQSCDADAMNRSSGPVLTQQHHRRGSHQHSGNWHLTT